MSANEKDEWKISTENRLQIFPQGSSQIYLTRPTKIFPKEALKFKTVSTPPDKYCDVLSKYGIRTAAMAEYKKYYYISRGTGTDAYTVCFYIGATNYRARFSDKIYSVKANDVLLIPMNSACDTSANRAKTVWFELSNTAFWQKVLGNNPICKSAKNFADIAFLADMYRREIYSTRPSLPNLSAIAGLIVDCICREFDSERLSADDKLSDFLREVEKSISENWTLKKACEKTGIGKGKLNLLLESKCGCTFSKYLLRLRMEYAAKLHKSGMNLSDIARLVGFSDGHALSYAFKKFYGESPENYSRK